MKRLIINADGFGFTFGNNRAILELLPLGFIRSVSVNATWPAIKDVATLTREFPDVSVGIHFNLTVGPPLLPPAELPTLVGADGEFHSDRFPGLAYRGLLNQEEMKRELRAQIYRLRDFGVTVTHWDSHQGRHLLPGYFEAAMSVALEEGIRASRSHRYYLILPGSRALGLAGYYWAHPRQIVTHAVAGRKMRRLQRAGIRLPDYRVLLNALGESAVHRPECWRLLLQKLPEGTSFIECHPGYVDDDLRRYSRITESRERERLMFGDSAWPQRAREAGVEIANFRTLLAGPSNLID